MKSYLGLIPLSAKVRRRQNRMTVLCILMAVLLVTAIFSMADMAIRMETARVIDTHGHWHAMLRSLPEETADAITAEPEVKAFARYDGLNFALAEDYTMDGKPCVVVGGDEAILTEIYDDLAEGHFPQSPDEILLSRRAKAMLSVEVGDQVTLHTPAGEFVYTISGFGADVTISSDASVVGAVLDWDAFASLADAEGYTMAPVWFVRLQDGANARKVLDRWRQQYGLTDETLSENTALLGLSGFSSDSYVMGMYLVAAVLFVLVLAAGVFMIAGSLNSQTAQRTQFYGMLRCIGASKAQIMHLVRWEALYWCRTAVPLGVAFGILLTWGLCALLRFGAGSEFVKIPLFAVSPVGIVCGVVVGVLTVLLSSLAPARRAAGVSPVAAVSGNDGRGSRAARPMRRTGRRVEVTLGIHHAVESRKNLLLMTGSFALSILLILAFSVMVQWVQLALNPLQPWAPDVFYSSPANACEIPKDFVGQVAAQPGVKRAFGRMYASLEAEYQGKTGPVDLISYEAQQFRWAQDSLTAGDLDAVRNGEGVLTVFDKSNSLRVGGHDSDRRYRPAGAGGAGGQPLLRRRPPHRHLLRGALYPAYRAKRLRGGGCPADRRRHPGDSDGAPGPGGGLGFLRPDGPQPGHPQHLLDVLPLCLRVPGHHHLDYHDSYGEQHLVERGCPHPAVRRHAGGGNGRRPAQSHDLRRGRHLHGVGLRGGLRPGTAAARLPV